ncbi:Uncharacterized protein OBRU01_08256 [Operophtera brumata]|uniref:Uncharacterized protein n=1 Tax=Operophtera brumata TaxID=104452 RepID=A0A0L7LHV2_OPEBR|nr:Uncharacterized protein OBRU01_08256 [Operophtera brumata]
MDACGGDQNAKMYLVAAAGCADDESAVAALPEQWVPRRGGTILANYLKEREQNHEIALKDRTTGAKTVNSAVDTKVREISENLLVLIQQTKKDMECVVEHTNVGESAITTNNRDEALKKIYQLHSESIDNMASFKRDALALERERADGLRILLRDQFQRLMKVGHRTPKDLLHEFDERAYEINQQLLSNSRAYTELEAQLRVQADETVVHARSALNRLSLGVGKSSRGRSALPWAHREQSLMRRSATAMSEKKHGDSEPSIGEILVNVKEFDACVACLVQAYKAAVTRVFMGVSGKLSDLEKDLDCHRQLLNDIESQNFQTDFQELIDKTSMVLSSSVYKTRTSQEMIELIGSNILTMQKSLRALGECLRDTYKILHDAGHLWDAHILRQALAQQLTIAAVEDLLTSNDTTEMANEIIFDIALEQLRGSSDPDKLQQQYDAIISMLDRTAEMYRTHSEAELGRMEEFMNLPTSLANTLLSEFDCFLEKHPRTINQTIAQSPVQGIASSQLEFASPKPGSVNSTYKNLHSSLSHAFMQTEVQEVALTNWRNGFLESFERNVTLVPEELLRQARLWVEERSDALHMRYSLKMVSHSIRVERVKASRDARLAELRNHKARLDSHLDAIYELVDKLPIEILEFASIDAPYLYPLCQWMSRMQADMEALLLQDPLDPEVKRLNMCSYAPRLIKHRRLFEESLDFAVEAYKKQIEYRIQNARVANVRFMSLISMFHEGGRYSALEATFACNSLMRGADALEVCVVRGTDALNARRNQLINLADQLILPLQKIVEEGLMKTGVKGAQKKPAPKKK